MDNFARHKTDTHNVRVTILLAETEAFGKMRANHIAIENGNLASVFEQQRCQHLRGRGFSRTTQAGEPNTKSLLVAWRIHLAQNLSGLGRVNQSGNSLPLAR